MGIFDLFKGNKIPYEIFHDNGKIKQRGYKDWLGRTTGLIKFYNQQGLIKQESQYLKNKKQGEEKLFYLNGDISSTQIYVEDKLEGKREMYYKNGKVKSQHTYKNNMVHGTCFNIDEDGKVSTGRFINDVKVDIKSKPMYDADGMRSEGEVNKENHSIGLHRTFKTENKGLTEYLLSEKEFGPRPNAPEFFTKILWLKAYHKNGKISTYNNKVLKKDSGEYVKAKKESDLNEIDFINEEYNTKGNLTFKQTGISEDPNGWHETYYNLDKVIQQGHIENGIKNGKWKIFNSETKKIIEAFYFPVVVEIVDNPNYSDLDNLKKGDKIAFEMSDKSEEIIPLKGTSFVVWSNPSFPPEDINRGYPVGQSKLIVDFNSATSSDKSFSKKIEKLKKEEGEYILEFSWNSKLETITKEAKISDEDTIDEKSIQNNNLKSNFKKLTKKQQKNLQLMVILGSAKHIVFLDPKLSIKKKNIFYRYKREIESMMIPDEGLSLNDSVTNLLEFLNDEEVKFEATRNLSKHEINDMFEHLFSFVFYDWDGESAEEKLTLDILNYIGDIVLHIFPEEVKVSKIALKKVLKRKLAAPVMSNWFEDSVNEDTGDIISIERNEIIIDRGTILEEKHIDEIILASYKSILLHKEDNEVHKIIESLIKEYSNSNILSKKTNKKILRYSNGKVHFELEFDDGSEDILNGSFKEFYESGILKMKGEYKNNKWHGKVEEYDEEGILVSKL